MSIFSKDIVKVKARKIGLILLTFFGIFLISFSSHPASGLNNYLQHSTFYIVFDVISTLILSALIVELHLLIDRKLNSVIPWNYHIVRRWILQTLIQIVFLLILLFVYTIFTIAIMDMFNIQFEAHNSEEKDLFNVVFSMILLSFIVGMLNTISFLSSNWREQIITAAEYKTQAAEVKRLVAETELKALRLQLDSHFVFNNLSVLSELILKDQQLGFEYSENFSKVYRYLLVNAKRQLITLGAEMKFLDAYLFLLKNRMGNGVEFIIQISEVQMDLQLPPITLQLLVENAIKHNRIDKDSPLQIKIYSSQIDEITIENTIKPLLKKPISSGIGLENIINRYRLLSNRIPVIEQVDNKFIVKIPLLK
ncbi:sensor histidine kinase [Pararhodonellum marinum]|uniref:sensor histidine kinase n=1 Tax=Pararhodonellum marinum TaxID=2755358 RepID=UPI00188F881D|nr:histidine kinase [Pararhodonellum marinum]